MERAALGRAAGAKREHVMIRAITVSPAGTRCFVAALFFIAALCVAALTAQLAAETFTLKNGMTVEGSPGKIGSIEGMQEAADRRIAEWKRTHVEPPPPELTASVAEARALTENKRLGYDTQGELSDNQMGIFGQEQQHVAGAEDRCATAFASVCRPDRCT